MQYLYTHACITLDDVELIFRTIVDLICTIANIKFLKFNESLMIPQLW